MKNITKYHFKVSSSAKAISDALEESFAQLIDFEIDDCKTNCASVGEKILLDVKSNCYEFTESPVDLKVNFSDSDDDFPNVIHGPPSGFKDFSEGSFSDKGNEN